MDQPEIVVHNIPRIEVFQVADHELDRIEEYGKNLANEFAAMLSFGSICVTLLVSIAAGQFSGLATGLFFSGAGVSAVATLYLLVRWRRNRKRVADVIGSIRDRRTDPQSNPPTPGNILT